MNILICAWCKHFHVEKANKSLGHLSCTAFPSGIPDEIRESHFDHRQSYQGDNGIQFALQTQENNKFEFLKDILSNSPLTYKSTLRLMLDLMENRGKDTEWYNPANYLEDSQE